MRDQLIQYVNLMFAGARDCEDIKQEILQNTLDRYDDLVAEGKAPEAAYRLAITGIGDINEILGTEPQAQQSYQAAAPVEKDNPQKKLQRAVGIGLYIICPIPMFMTDGSTLGLCLLLILVALATMLMVVSSSKTQQDDSTRQTQPVELTPQQELRKSIKSIISILGLAAYFIVSFATGAWYITWIIFPLTGAVQGLVRAILDLWEAVKNEN